MISIGQLSALDGMSTKASIGVLSRLSLSISSGPLNPAAEGNEPNEHALQTVITRQIAGLLKRRNGPDYHVGSEEILDEIDEMIEDAFDESLTNFDRTRRSINTDGLKLEDIYRDTIREVLYGDRLVRDALSFIRSGYFADNADMVNFALEALNADIHSLISIFKLSDFALIPKKEEAIIGIVDELAQGLLNEGIEYRPALILAGLSAIMHYRLSRYGILKMWSEKLGMNDASALLDDILTRSSSVERKLADSKGGRFSQSSVA